MAEPLPIQSFSTLPTELKSNVFAFIRTRLDQRAVCLVNKEWRVIMAPLLWETLASTFQPTSAMSLTALLQRNSGILPHVRKLHVCSDMSTARTDCDWSTEAVLRSIIGALPKNSLASFSSGTMLSASTFMHLLQNHSRLRNIFTRVDGPDSNEPLEIASVGRAPWITPNLSHVEQLLVYIDPENPTAQEESRVLIRTSKRLVKLEIWGLENAPSLESASTSIFDDNDLVISGQVKVLNLFKLGLCNLSFKPLPTTIFEHIDFSSLEGLRITRCKGARSFIHTLAAYYSRTSCNLKRLDLLLQKHPDTMRATVRAIERLLQCVPPLRQLYVDTGSDRLVNVTCLLRHGKALQTLWLATGRAEVLEHLTAENFVTLLDYCPLLKQFATNLCPIDLGPIESMGSNFALGKDDCLPQTELSAILNVLACQPKLHTLRVLSLPIIDYHDTPNPSSTNGVAIGNDVVSATQIAMNKLASQIMSYMVGRGSKIKVLAISPLTQPKKASRPNKDENGHRWPNYHYLRGRIIDARGMEQVTAIPLAHAFLEMPESTILWEH